MSASLNGITVRLWVSKHDIMILKLQIWAILKPPHYFCSALKVNILIYIKSMFSFDLMNRSFAGFYDINGCLYRAKVDPLASNNPPVLLLYLRRTFVLQIMIFDEYSLMRFLSNVREVQLSMFLRNGPALISALSGFTQNKSKFTSKAVLNQTTDLDTGKGRDASLYNQTVSSNRLIVEAFLDHNHIETSAKISKKVHAIQRRIITNECISFDSESEIMTGLLISMLFRTVSVVEPNQEMEFFPFN
jgi:hypothetical protein